VRPRMEREEPHEALEAIWRVVRAANAYVDHQAPWVLRKDDPERMATVLYVLAECLRHLAILTQPFVPDASARLLDQLAVPAGARDFSHLGPRHALAQATALPRPEGIFPRWDEAAAPAAS
jgi:methionyl-tRNA synthetase